LAKDSRRGAINRLSAECGFRAGVWGFTFELANNAGLDFSSHDIRYEQIAPNRHIQIASYQEVIVPVTFHIPGALREFADGRSKVEIEPSSATVADALAALWTLYPGVRDRIMNEQGQVREHINIFVGDEDIRYTGGLMSPLAAESQISIVPAISGG
jgi:sulfur-carrier protein